MILNGRLLEQQLKDKTIFKKKERKAYSSRNDWGFWEGIVLNKNKNIYF